MIISLTLGHMLRQLVEFPVQGVQICVEGHASPGKEERIQGRISN
jgi:hypothetical protein